MRKKAENGILTLTGIFFLLFTLIACNYYRLSAERQSIPASLRSVSVTINAGISEGTVYDRNMRPLVNKKRISAAAAVPELLNCEETAVYALDREAFLESFGKGEPFTFECREDTPGSEGLTVFSVPVRVEKGSFSACHVIGYVSQGEGVSGVEYAYDKILRGGCGENSVTYSADGSGNILPGDGKDVTRSTADRPGAVLTIDQDIQKICEEAGRDIRKGAIVCADVSTGDILALASFPEFDISDISSAVSDEDSPLLNRALCAYSVGSIFKLVTACEGIREGYSGYVYNCTGSFDADGKDFHCHKLDGHGIQTMQEAVTNSCNTYFISLSRLLDVKQFRELAFDLGFGRETHLCSGMTSSAGVLPTAAELMIPAELANFSFGQGKLTASPVQITQLTCAVANGGKMPMLRLIKGITIDGRDTANEKPPQLSCVMDEETALSLKKMMMHAVRDNDNSNAKASGVIVGAKTSTAQTGRFDEDGNELCHAWITGFFPAQKPAYAVTVLIEDGGYGNDAAAPVFREIAEKISRK